MGEDIAVAEASPGEKRQAVIHSFIVDESSLNGGGAAGADYRGEDRRSRFSRYVFFFHSPSLSSVRSAPNVQTRSHQRSFYFFYGNLVRRRPKNARCSSNSICNKILRLANGKRVKWRGLSAPLTRSRKLCSSWFEQSLFIILVCMVMNTESLSLLGLT